MPQVGEFTRTKSGFAGYVRAFSRAWRSIVCRFPGFFLRFQCSGMHRGVPNNGRVFA